MAGYPFAQRYEGKVGSGRLRESLADKPCAVLLTDVLGNGRVGLSDIVHDVVLRGVNDFHNILKFRVAKNERGHDIPNGDYRVFPAGIDERSGMAGAEFFCDGVIAVILGDGSVFQRQQRRAFQGVAAEGVHSFDCGEHLHHMHGVPEFLFVPGLL